jgi:hypothetical protein
MKINWIWMLKGFGILGFTLVLDCLNPRNFFPLSPARVERRVEFTSTTWPSG